MEDGIQVYSIGQILVKLGDMTNVNSISFDTTPTHTHVEGAIHWDEDDKTLNIDTEVTDTAIQVGQEQVVRATNKTGVQIDNGKAVYISGAQGSRPTIALADADNHDDTHKFIGIVTHDIADNATGYVTTFGLVRDIDTNSWAAGTVIYLSQTAGALTSTRPAAPAHGTQIGIVLFQNDTEGILFVNPDIGSELDELHDVLITTPTAGELLTYDGTKWVNGNTGALALGVQTASKSAAYTVGTDDSRECYGGVIYVTSAATITMCDGLDANMNFSVVTIGDIAVHVDPQADDKIVLDGATTPTDGEKASNTSTSGDKITCVYYSADGWYCASSTNAGGQWTNGG
jgi:hypothetical protein